MTTTRDETRTPDWKHLLATWDTQQEVYIEHRERRYDVMFEFLDALHTGPIRLLDIGSGPGALSRRVLDRYPDADVVAVDADPVLLHLGQQALGSYDGRLRFVRADLRRSDWAEPFADASFDIVASSTATHWLPGPELAAMYRSLARLLTPTGIVLNADYLPIDDTAPRIRTAAESIDDTRQSRLLDSDAESWDQWWTGLETNTDLADLFAERAAIFPPDERDRRTADLDMHRVALRDAGFMESAVVWQDLQERLLVAVR